MFGLFRAARPRVPRLKSRVVLRLTDLEGRDQPDGGTGDPPTQPDGQFNPANLAPVIEDFDAEEVGNGTFLITGRVIDEMPDGLVVALGGGTSAAGTTVVCDADGYFSVIVQLRTDGTDSGYITATTVDAQGLESEEVEVFVSPTPP
jgi:hypothetical protein